MLARRSRSIAPVSRARQRSTSLNGSSVGLSQSFDRSERWLSVSLSYRLPTALDEVCGTNTHPRLHWMPENCANDRNTDL